MKQSKKLIPPARNPQNLKISNYINTNNLTNFSQIKTIFPYSPQIDKSKPLSQSMKNLINPTDNNKTNKNSNNKLRRKILFDRKLTPDPIKKVQGMEMKRKLTPNKITKGQENILKKQFFIKKNENSQNPQNLSFVKTHNITDTWEKKSPSIKKFEALFQGFFKK